MKYLCIFTQKQYYKDFAIQELLSLLDLYEIPTNELFKYELDNKQFDPTNSDLTLFQNYPFLILNIDEKYNQQLLKIFDRAINLKRIGVLLGHGDTYEQLQQQVKSNKACHKEVPSQKTFAFKIITHEQTLTRKEQIKRIENLGFEQFKAKCDLKKPERIFIIGENYTSKQKFKHVFLAKDITNKFKTNLFTFKYSLKDRPFLGPTSTDENLAFQMINQGLVKQGSFVFDPFLGSGSILIAASVMGAQCFGGEIDYRILHGLGVGQLNKRTSYKKKIEKQKMKVDCFLNFKIYGLNKPEFLRIDSVGTQFRNNKFLDAIICDPPYGIRAGVRETSTKPEKKINPQTENHITPLQKTKCLALTKKLFNLGRQTLRKDGRLVFLYPQSVNSKLPEELQYQQDYELISVCNNPLNTKTIRLMITYKKIN